METLWLTFLLLSLLSSSPGSTHNLHGLSCLNDYINNITCVWNSSGIDPELGCRLLGTRINYKMLFFQSGCNLKPLDGLARSFRGCSFVFEGHQFSSAEHLSSMKVDCNGSEIVNLQQYSPIKHIKMHPPVIPVIVNGTNLTFSAGTRLSKKIFSYEFLVRLKREDQLLRDAINITKTEKEPWVEMKMEKPGLYHIRVMVRATQPSSATWSDWSPTVEYRVLQTFNRPGAVVGRLDPRQLTADITVWLVPAGVFVLLLILVLVYKVHRNNRNSQYVPDPAKYFHTLNSVHDGNFQKWLSPLFAPEAFNPAQPCEDASTLEVAGTEVCGISRSTFCTTVALHHHSDPDTPTGYSSSQSSFYSNVGYFYSNHASGLCLESCPVYFTYQEDLTSLAGATSSSYERLQNLDWPQREPQSPDSGFGIENAEDLVEEEGESKMALVDLHPPPVLVLPLSWPQQASSVPQPPLQMAEMASDTGPGSTYNARPVEGAIERSSTCSGYLTVKELQNTYSNKSI